MLSVLMHKLLEGKRGARHLEIKDLVFRFRSLRLVPL